jgi:hypothetical protein
MSGTTSPLPYMPSWLLQGQRFVYFTTHSVPSVREIIAGYPECYTKLENSLCLHNKDVMIVNVGDTHFNKSVLSVKTKLDLWKCI